jgi:hypothetical protein
MVAVNYDAKVIIFFKVIFGTLFSSLFNFNGRWNIKIVGDVPRGYLIYL